MVQALSPCGVADTSTETPCTPESPAGEAAAILRAFSAFDLDGDGALTRTELATVLRYIDGEGIWNDANLDALFRDVDANQDGVLRPHELIAWLTSPAANSSDHAAAFKRSMQMEDLHAAKTALLGGAGQAGQVGQAAAEAVDDAGAVDVPSSWPAPEDDWFSKLFGFAETDYATAKSFFSVAVAKDGHCTLTSQVNQERFGAGRFHNPTLDELRRKGSDESSKLLLSGVLRVSHAFGDVSVHQAKPENKHATFQVASQFNCLEFPSQRCVPEDGVAGYESDRTQGPACSISAGPATVFRNYFVCLDANGVVVSPGARRQAQEGQTASLQVNNLGDINSYLDNSTGRFFELSNGYTLSTDEKLRPLQLRLDKCQETEKDKVRQRLRVGIHEDVQVTSQVWGRRRVADREHTITQVFGSACSVSYSRGSSSYYWSAFAKLVLEASYEAALWASLEAAIRHHGKHGSKKLFLTCLGGGVFGNSMDWISGAMNAAFAKFKDCDLEVIIVSYARPPPPEMVQLGEAWGAEPFTEQSYY